MKRFMSALVLIIVLCVPAFALSDAEFLEMKKDPEFSEANRKLNSAYNQAKKSMTKAKFERLKTRSKTQDKSTNIRQALEFCHQVLHRRAVIFLISDFLDDNYLETLRSVHRKHDVISVLVNDKREFDVVDEGLLTLEDAESGEVCEIDTSSASFRKFAKEQVTARIDRLRASFQASGCDLIEIDATESVIDPLLAFFKQRQKRFR